MTHKIYPFDICDQCPDGEDEYPPEEIVKFGEYQLCKGCAGTWRPSDILPPDDDYDRVTKSGDDK